MSRIHGISLRVAFVEGTEIADLSIAALEQLVRMVCELPLALTGPALALEVQRLVGVAVYPDALATATGVPAWLAGFDLYAEYEGPLSSVTAGNGSYLCLTHGQAGATPAEAILRAVVACAAAGGR